MGQNIYNINICSQIKGGSQPKKHKNQISGIRSRIVDKWIYELLCQFIHDNRPEISF